MNIIKAFWITKTMWDFWISEEWEKMKLRDYLCGVR